MKDTTDFEELKELAMTLGASDVAITSTSNIEIDGKLVSFCKNPRCENYGLSPGCPPHVSGPDGFRQLLKERSHVLVVRIVVPSTVLFSDERRELMAFLHELVATVELAAIKKGFNKSKAFAGGSCKDLFCFDENDCNVLSGRGECRNPTRSRPSMSGFGVNVSKLLKSCGWESNIKAKESGDDPLSWVAGIVLLG
ncbi:MAG: putative metal-binding protein [Desulforhopalus sp.]|jgi:predicted metal-binding protein